MRNANIRHAFETDVRPQRTRKDKTAYGECVYNVYIYNIMNNYQILIIIHKIRSTLLCKSLTGAQ